MICNSCLLDKEESYFRMFSKKCRACSNLVQKKWVENNLDKDYSNSKLEWKNKNPTYQKETRESPIGRYRMHKKNAELRDVPWEFTFDSWWKVWEDSGKWLERGKGTNKYQMCRSGDMGPYSPDNVRIATQLENIQERFAKKCLT